MINDYPTSLPGRWMQFINERFPLLIHLITVSCFVLGNGTIAIHIQTGSLEFKTIALAILITLSFFFRLRCFDEIKDFETDCQVNPTRPLARGVLEIPQVQHVIYSLTLFEIVLAALLGPPVLLTHTVAVAYSYLMYKEFFIGSWLSGHLTTYAVTHTFVSTLIGYSIISQFSGRGLDAFSQSTLVFSLLNWNLFNLFEFARKTYAPAEERQGVDTYSSQFSPGGAVLLSLSQIICSLFILSLLPRHILGSAAFDIPGLWLQVALALFLPTLPAVILTIRPTPGTARLFRTLTSVYLPSFYALLAFQALT
jgi:4-hydroxybenzoate polyprenyltransferase